MCPWEETIIHTFAADPIWFPYAALTFDSAGIYTVPQWEGPPIPVAFSR
jgi:hypothetical protein